MKWLRAVALLAVGLLVLAGCGLRTQTDESSPGKGSGFNQAPAAPPEMVREQSLDLADGSFTSVEQKLIRTAEIAFDVKNIDDALAEIRRVTKIAGGYSAELNISGADGERFAWLTLRLPAAKLDQVLAELEVVGKRTNLRVGDQDVTLQYVDLEARIRNAERQEERLLEILGKAEKVEDILRVEQELARVRGLLETMTAEFRYLRDQVELSTISVSLKETPTASPTITGSGLRGVWQRGLAGLIDSVNAMLAGLGNGLVFLFTAFPYLLLFAGVGVPAALVARKFWVKKLRKTDASDS
ncbi:MAG: DUF4349 domain-containing protein [Firmicutes bacterium]|nr:DUF4349 domain-containing protein [Bacillota bacterium]MCL5993283.1 DUF4349 domain-containing protein [Bacillota bacterium]